MRPTLRRMMDERDHFQPGFYRCGTEGEAVATFDQVHAEAMAQMRKAKHFIVISIQDGEEGCEEVMVTSACRFRRPEETITFLASSAGMLQRYTREGIA